MRDLNQKFEAEFIPRIQAFVQRVETLDTSGIPEPHLPHWGVDYANAPIRIGIIGRDTRSWGNMPTFIEAVGADAREALYRGKGEFDSLDFTGWTNNFGRTFWDTSMKILAAIHDVEDWKSLKRQTVTAPLKSFFWANVNSVERFEVSPRANGVPWDVWHQVKLASEEHLDSFRAILDILRPHVVFLLNWDPGEHFLDFPLSWTEFGNHLAEATDPETGCLILATAHPTWLNQNGLYDEAIAGIIQKANKAVHPTATRVTPHA
jgi:hypothetical protein